MLPASSTIGRLLRLPLKLVPDLVPMRVLSGPLAGKRWLSTSATHGCWLGTYESELQREIVACLKVDDIFYDVGANVGFFSLLASYRAAQVFAFEPVGRNVELMRRNFGLNDRRNITIIEAAVSDTVGTARFATGNSASQGTLGEEGVEVKAVSLDSLDLPAPSVIKMDIEGAESRALAGAERILRNHRPLIFLSTHGWKQHDECGSFLRGLGYSLTLRRDGAADGQYESVARP
jgi:FkbM family methyltransferase